MFRSSRFRSSRRPALLVGVVTVLGCVVGAQPACVIRNICQSAVENCVSDTFGLTPDHLGDGVVHGVHCARGFVCKTLTAPIDQHAVGEDEDGRFCDTRTRVDRFGMDAWDAIHDALPDSFFQDSGPVDAAGVARVRSGRMSMASALAMKRHGWVLWLLAASVA